MRPRPYGLSPQPSRIERRQPLSLVTVRGPAPRSRAQSSGSVQDANLAGHSWAFFAGTQASRRDDETGRIAACVNAVKHEGTRELDAADHTALHTFVRPIMKQNF
ncbi:hypothetical protein MTO96_011856 [Rhipicephalus appendiculatus]